MPYEDLHKFLERLEDEGELRRVEVPVDPDLEIAEILRRVMYRRGPAVLFEKIRGYDIPVVGNIFGSEKRLQLAFETDRLEELGERFILPLKMRLPTSFVGKVLSLPKLAELSGYAAKSVKKGPVDEIVETQNPSFDFLPAIRQWPKDAGRFITFPLVFTKEPDTGVVNFGVYRLQIFDSKTCGMHWQIQKRGAQNFLKREGRGEKTEVAIVIGCDPATVFAGAAPVPEGFDKLTYAGFLRREGVKVVKGETVDLEVPANADIVLEGYVAPHERRMEGPFGDHGGYYSPPSPYPVFHLTAVKRRENPVFLVALTGKPILEDAYIGKVIERSFLPLLKVLHPEIVDFHLPPHAIFQGLAVVSIKKTYPAQARKVMLGLWGTGQMSMMKCIIVVDDDIDVHDLGQVLWAVSTRVDFKRDVMIIDAAPTDSLDHASPYPDVGAKMGIDATAKWRSEGYSRDWPEVVQPDKEIEKLVDSKWASLGIFR